MCPYNAEEEHASEPEEPDMRAGDSTDENRRHDGEYQRDER